MEFNKLPENFKDTQKRRTEFTNTAEKLEYDARNLINFARKIFKETGVSVNPIFLATRKDDDIDSLRKTIATCLKNFSLIKKR
ncbi:hypothetical protein HZA39_04490 [Candidatus Peregrinibacteria bacterium]|nr:hypothetical protein [Candidatus Peregrinibacteria bacterium]